MPMKKWPSSSSSELIPFTNKTTMLWKEQKPGDSVMPTMERLTLTRVHLRVPVTKNAIPGRLKRVDQDGHSRHIYKGEDEQGGCAATISLTSAESVGRIPFPWPQMAQRDVTDLQEAMGCVPVMDTLRNLAVVSSFKLYGPFHIPNSQETLGDSSRPQAWSRLSLRNGWEAL